MIHVRVHVRVEPVLVRCGSIPAIYRLLVSKTDPHNRLRAFETILPGNHNAQRRAILIRQDFTVHSETKQRERVHSLIHAQTLNVWPIEHGDTLPRHRSEEHTSELQSLTNLVCRL